MLMFNAHRSALRVLARRRIFASIAAFARARAHAASIVLIGNDLVGTGPRRGTP